MTDPELRAALKTAVSLAWIKFMADTKIKPEDFNETDAIIFHAAFSLGASWVMELTKETVKQ